MDLARKATARALIRSRKSAEYLTNFLLHGTTVPCSTDAQVLLDAWIYVSDIDATHLLSMVALVAQREILSLRLRPVEHPREGNRFSHVFQAADPGDAAFDAHAKTAVRDGAVAAQVDVPVEGLLR